MKLYLELSDEKGGTTNKTVILNESAHWQETLPIWVENMIDSLEKSNQPL